MTTPATFRTRPAEIAAMQWTGDNAAELEAWTGGLFEPMEPHRRPADPAETTAMIFADGKWYGIRTGTWVIAFGDGRLATVAAADFETTYEPVVDAPTIHPLRAERQRQGLTLWQVAQRLPFGASASAVARWEKGAKPKPWQEQGWRLALGLDNTYEQEAKPW